MSKLKISINYLNKISQNVNNRYLLIVKKFRVIKKKMIILA